MKKVVLIKKRFKGLESVTADNSYILKAKISPSLKRRINYNHFIRLALYNGIILSIMIYLINLI
tara:strand:+ start:224 stop:415 length:192 start_codon:yes stop_codon:yes gene_type:complete